MESVLTSSRFFANVWCMIKVSLTSFPQGLVAAVLCAAPLALLTSCVQVRTEPIRIEPIYIEVTINHRVQKELDDVFADIDKASDTADFAPIEGHGSE